MYKGQVPSSTQSTTHLEKKNIQQDCVVMLTMWYRYKKQLFALCAMSKDRYLQSVDLLQKVEVKRQTIHSQQLPIIHFIHPHSKHQKTWTTFTGNKFQTQKTIKTVLNQKQWFINHCNIVSAIHTLIPTRTCSVNIEWIFEKKMTCAPSRLDIWNLMINTACVVSFIAHSIS